MARKARKLNVRLGFRPDPALGDFGTYDVFEKKSGALVCSRRTLRAAIFATVKECKRRGVAVGEVVPHINNSLVADNIKVMVAQVVKEDAGWEAAKARAAPADKKPEDARAPRDEAGDAPAAPRKSGRREVVRLEGAPLKPHAVQAA